MISKKAKELLESSHYGHWNNSWWEGPEYLGEVVNHDDAVGIIEEAEEDVIEIIKQKILETLPDKSIENLLDDIIREIKNEK